MRTYRLPLVLLVVLAPLRVFAQAAATPAPEAAPAATPAPAAAPAPAPAPAEAAPPAAPPKKRAAGPSLGLSPEAPQAGGQLVSPAEPPPVVAVEPSADWKFDVTGYFRAPMRFSWGPPTTQDTRTNATGSAGTQLRTPPLVPDANYIDWRYTNSFVAPWTELNFHYGNDRVKATVQIASYNLTDPGYRRLESNLGINLAFITMLWPELGGSENWHLTATVGGFTNRYGAAGRYDAGKYETYIFGRTHVAGETLNLAYDLNDAWTFQVEETFGAKLEPIPFYGAPLGSSAGMINAQGTSTVGNANQDLPAWEPYPGPKAMESTFVASLHLGAVFKRALLLGLHWIDTFANDNEESSAYEGVAFGPGSRVTGAEPNPYIMTYGFDAKLLGGVLGDGYLGVGQLKAQNAIYLQDAIEVLHSFGGWQLHDNYFGAPGGTDPVTGTITTVELQYSLSIAQIFWYPQAFWGQGPDLIATIFGMFNHVYAPDNMAYTMNKLKFGAEITYLPLAWFGVGGRYDVVQPDLDDSGQNFSVFSPRLYFRTDFVTHEQILVQYSRYFYGSKYGPGQYGGMFPYDSQTGGAGLGLDKNAFQIAAIIWF